MKSNKSNGNEKIFICELKRELSVFKNKKVYAMNIDQSKYPDIKINKYDNITIVGDIQELQYDVPYTVRAKEVEDKRFGYQYEVINIKRDKPMSELDVRNFLSKIISNNQSNEIMKHYPNIIDIVIKGELNTVDVSKLYGIGETTLNKIAEKIQENFGLIEIMDEYGGYGISIGMLKKLLEKYKSVDRITELLKKNPYKALCGISGVGFNTADQIILKLPPEKVSIDGNVKQSKQRMRACINYILEENQKAGNTKISASKLKSKAKELTPDCSHHFVDIIKHKDEYHIDSKDKTIGFEWSYRTEKYIADKLDSILMNSFEYDIDYTKYSKTDEGYDLSEEQMNALKNLCKYNVSLLIGAAGAGKSSSANAIVNMLEQNNLSFELMAPTGRASQVISEIAKGKEASTIHRALLKINSTTQFTKKVLMDDKNNPHRIPYFNCDVLIVDEVSMVDINLMALLLRSVSPRTKLLFIQDSYQIPSVSCGNISEDMIQSKRIPTTILTKIFRYAEGGLYNVATKIRQGKKYVKEDMENKNVLSFGEKKDYSLITSNISPKSVASMYSQLLKKGSTIEDIMVLSHHNKGDHGTIKLNKEIKRMVNPDSEDRPRIKYKDTVYNVGDKVIHIENNYNAEDPEGSPQSIYNGNMGIVEDINSSNYSMIVDYGNKKIVYHKENIGQLMMGYSISKNKSQGGSAKIVIVYSPDSHIYFINRNLLYTAITRTKKQCYHFATPRLINIALKKSETRDRQTYLRRLLVEKIVPSN